MNITHNGLQLQNLLKKIFFLIPHLKGPKPKYIFLEGGKI